MGFLLWPSIIEGTWYESSEKERADKQIGKIDSQALERHKLPGGASKRLKRKWQQDDGSV